MARSRDAAGVPFVVLAHVHQLDGAATTQLGDLVGLDVHRPEGSVRPMRVFNLHDATVEYDPSDPDGYRGGAVNFKDAIGARTMTGKLFELPPGQALCPYHWETDEEWLLVLQG